MSRTGTDAAWNAIRLEIPEALEDRVVGELAWFASGFEVQALDGNRCRIDAYLRSDAEADRVLEHAAAVLRGADLDPASVRVVKVDDGRWVERYQASLKPFPLGRRFLVQPAGATGAADPREPLLLVPGRAFGTGEHATTQLCVEQLEQRVRSGDHWLDLGCGTGILGLVAQRCGAEHVLAVDRDAEAIEVARETFSVNGAGEGIELRVGSLELARGRGWDGVACNIAAPFFEEHAAELAVLPAAGAPLLATGFHESDLPGVRDALEARGLRPAQTRRKAPWALLVMERP